MERKKEIPETAKKFVAEYEIRRQRRLEKRAQRIAEARNTIEQETCPIRIRKAEHYLEQVDYENRIEALKEELRERKKQQWEEIRALRRKENGSFARSKRRVDSDFISASRWLIKRVIQQREASQLKLFSDEKPFIISFGQVADFLNRKNHRTQYGKAWSRASVKRFMEKHMRDELSHVGFDANSSDAAQIAKNSKRKKVEEFARYMEEEVLPSIDITQKHHVIAEELNRKGFKTRLKGEWGNVAVGRLLKEIKKLHNS